MAHFPGGAGKVSLEEDRPGADERQSQRIAVRCSDSRVRSDRLHIKWHAPQKPTYIVDQQDCVLIYLR